MKNKNHISDILFQKLGNTWYAFTETENDVHYTALPAGVDPKTTKLELFEVIEDHIKAVAKACSNETIL